MWDAKDSRNDRPPRAGIANPYPNRSSYGKSLKRTAGIVSLFLTVSFIALLTIPVLQSCKTVESPSPTPTTTPEVLRLDVTLDALYPPFMIVDSVTGEVAGFSIDFAREIAKAGGFNVEFVIGYDYSNAKFSTIPYAREYLYEYDCSEPYYEDGVICVKKGNTSLLNLVNRGIKALPPGTAMRLEEKWRIPEH